MINSPRRVINKLMALTVVFAALISLPRPAAAQSDNNPSGPGYATPTLIPEVALDNPLPNATYMSQPVSPDFATATGTTDAATALDSVSFSTIAIATDTPGLPPIIIPSTLTSYKTAASDTLLILGFFNTRMDRCMAGEMTDETLDALLQAYMDIENPALQSIVPDTIECLAMAEDNPSVCSSKFNLLTDEARVSMPFQSLISACESRLADFRMYSESFRPDGNCEQTLGRYCEQRGICNNQPPDKICTCGLYAAMWCNIPRQNEPEQCEGIRERVRKELSGATNDAALIDKFADNAAQTCKKAVLGFNPRIDENDEGASQMLFFGGLFLGARWPVFQQGGDPGSFGLATPNVQWYYTAHQGRSCLSTLGAFKKEFCYLTARSGAQSDFAEEKANQKTLKDTETPMENPKEK